MTFLLLDYLVIGGVLCFTAFVNALVGFGFGILGLPILFYLGYWDISLVPLLLYLSFYINCFLLYTHRSYLSQIPRPTYLLCGGALAIVPSFWVIHTFQLAYFQQFLGYGVLLLTLLLFFDFRMPFHLSRFDLIVVGFITGVFQACFAMSGPFLVFCLAQIKENPIVFILRLILFYTVMNAFLVFFYIWQSYFSGSL